MHELQGIGHTMKRDSDFYAPSGQLTTGEDLRACQDCGTVVSWYIEKCPLCALARRLEAAGILLSEAAE